MAEIQIGLKKLHEKLRKQNQQMEKIKKIANNVLYFDDNSDYDTALWQILAIVSPELFKDDDPTPELSYIEST